MAVYGKLPGGDCWNFAEAIMLDLAEAAPLRHDWHIVSGNCKRIGKHFWLEADG